MSLLKPKFAPKMSFSQMILFYIKKHFKVLNVRFSPFCFYTVIKAYLGGDLGKKLFSLDLGMIGAILFLKRMLSMSLRLLTHTQCKLECGCSAFLEEN
jgi:hypothetical protein